VGITGVQVSYLFICRTKLWLFSHNTRMEQNSVFEGGVTKATLREIENGLKELIDPELDSIIIFVLRDEKFLERRYIGEPKVELTNIL